MIQIETGSCQCGKNHNDHKSLPAGGLKSTSIKTTLRNLKRTGMFFLAYYILLIKKRLISLLNLQKLLVRKQYKKALGFDVS